MRTGTQNFDWTLYKEPLKSKLYEKAKNSKDLNVLFSPRDLRGNFIIPCDDTEKFMNWLKNEKIASLVKIAGNNLFEFMLTDSFMNEMSDKEIGINMEKK